MLKLGNYIVPQWSLERIIDEAFDLCTATIYYIGNLTGAGFEGYQVLNLVLFIFLQPSLILLFFMLWRKAMHKNKQLKEDYRGILKEISFDK